MKLSEIEAAHLGVVDGPAVQPAEDVPAEGARRGRLVRDPTLDVADVRLEPVQRRVQSFAVEAVRRGVPRRQLRRVQVPALVEAVLEGAADQPVVVVPGGPDRCGVPDREHVGRSVGEPDAGARGRGLHDQLGVVGDRVLQRLVGGRDTAEGRVVVGAVVQPDQPAAAGVHHPGDQCRAVRTEDRLRRLDLDLEPDVQGLGHVHHRVDLVDAGDLGQRDDPAVERAACVSQRRDVGRESPDAAGAGRCLEALDPDAAERRRLGPWSGSRPAPARSARRRRSRRRRSCRRSRPRSRPAGPRPARSPAWRGPGPRCRRPARGPRTRPRARRGSRAPPRRTPAPARRRTGPPGT